jgi:hypothetical protein
MQRHHELEEEETGLITEIDRGRSRRHSLPPSKQRTAAAQLGLLQIWPREPEPYTKVIGKKTPGSLLLGL